MFSLKNMLQNVRLWKITLTSASQRHDNWTKMTNMGREYASSDAHEDLKNMMYGCGLSLREMFGK